MAVPSIGADDLDKTYHTSTKFEVEGPTAKAFESSLEQTASIFEVANRLSVQRGRKKNKYKKMDVVSVLLLTQDLGGNPSFKWSRQALEQVAERVLDEPSPTKSGKSISGRAIAAYYETWRETLPYRLGIRLDEKRFFDAEQKAALFNAAAGRCAICKKEVADEDGEYDHFPTPHYLGGRTEVENGRLVCQACHPRGRPTAE